MSFSLYIHIYPHFTLHLLLLSSFHFTFTSPHFTLQLLLRISLTILPSFLTSRLPHGTYRDSSSFTLHLLLLLSALYRHFSSLHFTSHVRPHSLTLLSHIHLHYSPSACHCTFTSPSFHFTFTPPSFHFTFTPPSFHFTFTPPSFHFTFTPPSFHFTFTPPSSFHFTFTPPSFLCYTNSVVDMQITEFLT